MHSRTWTKSIMQPAPWTKEQDAILREFWLIESAEQVAKRIGKTRNAVIGHARRMRLPSKKVKGSGRKSGPKPKPAKVHVSVTPVPRPEPPEAPRPEEAIPLIEANAWQCKAVMPGKDARGLAMVCGRPYEPGSFYSFCPYHMDRYIQIRRD